MGLDHALRRRNEPKDILERTIKALDFTNDEDEDFEELFCWRKDYTLHDFFEKIENCEEKKLSKQGLIIFLNFLKDHNGENDEYFKDDKLNYDKEIEVLSSILKLR